MRFPRGKGPTEPVHAVRRTGRSGPRFNYELFNRNNFNIRYWSWNYRGCWPFKSNALVLNTLECPVFTGDWHVPQAFTGRHPSVLSAGPRALLGIGTGQTPWKPPPIRDVSPEDLRLAMFSGPHSLWRQLLTRLALQLFLVKGFKLYSFQLQDPKEPCISISRHYPIRLLVCCRTKYRGLGGLALRIGIG
jgi:hypothetical protein